MSFVNPVDVADVAVPDDISSGVSASDALKPDQLSPDKALNDALLAAHAAMDHDSLVTLYQQAGEMREAAGNIDAACFYYTHAFVFALETGHSAATSLRAILAEHGREVAEED